MNVPDDGCEYRVVIKPNMADRLGTGAWLIRYVNRNGRFMSQCAKPISIEWEDKGDGFYFGEPSLTLPIGMLSAWAEALIEAKSLPNNFLKNDEELSAVKEHLKDKRETSERLLKILEDKL